MSDDKKSHGHVYKYKSYDEYKKEQQGVLVENGEIVL